MGVRVTSTRPNNHYRLRFVPPPPDEIYWKVAAQTLLRMFYPSYNLKHSVFYELQNLNEYKDVIEGLHGGRKYWEEYRLSEIESIESTPDYFDDQMSRGHKL